MVLLAWLFYVTTLDLSSCPCRAMVALVFSNLTRAFHLFFDIPSLLQTDLSYFITNSGSSKDANILIKYSFGWALYILCFSALRSKTLDKVQQLQLKFPTV